MDLLDLINVHTFLWRDKEERGKEASIYKVSRHFKLVLYVLYRALTEIYSLHIASPIHEAIKLQEQPSHHVQGKCLGSTKSTIPPAALSPLVAPISLPLTWEETGAGDPFQAFHSTSISLLGCCHQFLIDSHRNADNRR